MVAAGIDLTEPEYARLLQAAAAGAPWPAVRAVLLRMGRELTELQRPTLARAAALFASHTAAAAFDEQQQGQQGDGAPRWVLEDCRVGPEGEVTPCGTCSVAPAAAAGMAPPAAAAGGEAATAAAAGGEAAAAAAEPPAAPAAAADGAANAEAGAAAANGPSAAPLPGRMGPVDLDAQEWVAFREGIAALAEKQERRPNEFKKVRGLRRGVEGKKRNVGGWER